MNTINILETKFQNLENLRLESGTYNAEADMYRINIQGKEKILKSLIRKSGIVFANKLYTIEMLDDNNKYLPQVFYIPDSLISVKGKIIGFTIPPFKGKTLQSILNSKEIEEREKLYYLKRVGDVLEQLRNIRKYSSLKDIYINDLYESNIMVNTHNKEIGFIDLDSCKIGHNCAFEARYLVPNSKLDNKPYKYNYNESKNGYGYIIANENSDIYCYVIMILNYLFGNNTKDFTIEQFYEYLNYLDRIGFDKELLQCLEKISLDCDNINPRDYLETITDNQIYRARKRVYDIAKSKI